MYQFLDLEWRGPPPKRPRHILKPFLQGWLQARMRAFIITARQLQRSRCYTCFAAPQHERLGMGTGVRRLCIKSNFYPQQSPTKALWIAQELIKVVK